MQLTILGTSHIASESLNKVKETIGKGSYDILALELDSQRLYSLLQKTRHETHLRDMLKIGVKGYFFGLFGAWAERRLGEMVGMKPGAEMIAAYRLAKKKGMQISLIDQRIDITLKRLSESFTWREKMNFVLDIVGNIAKRQKMEFDLRKVPPKDVIQKLIERVKNRYPNLYKVLVTERNEVMAANLATLLQQYPEKKIIAIVGAGHEEELFTLVRQKAGTVPNISYKFSVGEDINSKVFYIKHGMD
jgi:pheromone shutdown-related protein TraB